MYRQPPIMRIIALALVIMIVLSASSGTVYAATPRASYFLDSYNTYIYPAALGKIQVWYSITGVEYMDDIGVLTIQLYESTDNQTWNWVKTYTHDSTSGMLAQNDYYHSGHVDYSGTIGRYYKAYVCIWAGKDGSGDTRYMWTQPKKATLFAG